MKDPLRVVVIGGSDAGIGAAMRVADIADLDLSYTPPLSSPWDPVQVAAMHWCAGERARA